MITLYSTGCPRCSVLKKKLEGIGAEFVIVDDVEKMMEMGITTVPMMQVDGAVLMNFTEAVKWIKQKEDDDAIS